VWTKLFYDINDLMVYAKTFSIDNNIVESKDWANLIIETGEDGGAPPGQGKGIPKTEMLNNT
jgi:hypothetical protein